MKYIIRDEKRRTNAIEHLRGASIQKPLEVFIRPYKRSRSLSQNSLMWMWIHEIAQHTGYTDDELHEQFKVRILGVEEKTVEGIKLVQPKSTTELKPEDMTNYLNEVEKVARSMSIALPYPDDYKYAMMGV